MNETQTQDYVTAAAAALGLRLDAARAKSVAQQLQRTAAMAALLADAGLAPELEPAEVFKPAPFPLANDGAEGS
jgi:hypothetical protein